MFVGLLVVVGCGCRWCNGCWLLAVVGVIVVVGLGPCLAVVGVMVVGCLLVVVGLLLFNKSSFSLVK